MLYRDYVRFVSNKFYFMLKWVSKEVHKRSSSYLWKYQWTTSVIQYYPLDKIWRYDIFMRVKNLGCIFENVYSGDTVPIIKNGTYQFLR